MLFDERLAYGARAAIMASTVVSGAIFLRMIAVEKKQECVRMQCLIQTVWDFVSTKDTSLLSPQNSPLGWFSDTPGLLLGSPSAENKRSQW